MKLNAKQLRVTKPTDEELAKIQRKPVWIILDNVLDTYNIGSIFRLADAAGVTEVILCRGSETPPNTRIHKAAVGTEEWVPWRYFVDAKTAITNLKSQIPNLRVIAIEQDKRSVDSVQWTVDKGPMAIVVGHETEGVTKEVLDLADEIVEIPMWGINKSLNVHVSAAIVLYKLLSN